MEEAKRQAAERAVADHFTTREKFVGIGSGTTIVHVVEAIKEKLKATREQQQRTEMCFVPTGRQSRQVIVDAGLTPVELDGLAGDAMLDVSFDGADEVDEELNCIKGGGACLFQEKLVVERSRKFICVADYRKDRSRLLTGWPTVPIEVSPLAIPAVTRALLALGSSCPAVRTLSPLSQPDQPPPRAPPLLKTDQEFCVIDAPFSSLLVASDISSSQPGNGSVDGKWAVGFLASRIKQITGVLEVGIFCGANGPEALAEGCIGGQKPVAAYFGMADGSVKVRTG